MTLGQLWANANHPTNSFLSVPAVLWHYTNIGPTMAPQYIVNGHFSYIGPLLVQCSQPNRPKSDIGPTMYCYLGTLFLFSEKFYL
jgi:hypothetical protein